MSMMDEIRAERVERAERDALARRREFIRTGAMGIVAAVCGVAVVFIASLEVESSRVESSAVEASRVADW